MPPRASTARSTPACSSATARPRPSARASATTPGRSTCRRSGSSGCSAGAVAEAPAVERTTDATMRLDGRRVNRARTHAAVARAIPDAYPDRCDELAAMVPNIASREASRSRRRAGTRALVPGRGRTIPPTRCATGVRCGSLVEQLPDSAEAVELRFSACPSILGFGGRTGMPEREIAEVYADGRAPGQQLAQAQMIWAWLLQNEWKVPGNAEFSRR